MDARGRQRHLPQAKLRWTCLLLLGPGRPYLTHMSQHSDLTDSQWEILHPLVPEPKRREDGRGRPWKGHREVLNGILYVLRTGVAWADLPEGYPPYQTCHRRFQQWLRSGVMRTLLEALTEGLQETGEPDTQKPLVEEPLRFDRWPGVLDIHSRGNGEAPARLPASSVLQLLASRIRR
jgi:transposase